MNFVIILSTVETKIKLNNERLLLALLPNFGFNRPVTVYQ